ncbi:MAG: penicillin-binding protein 2 [Patescibacteria group bacterium]
MSRLLKFFAVRRIKIRLAFLFFIFAGIYGILIFNLYNLQLKKNFYYSVKAAAQNAGIEPELKRGNIYFSDRNNDSVPAAINREFPFIYAVPEEIDDAKEAAAMLEPVVNIAVDVLEKKFSKEADQFEVVLDKASVEQADAARVLNLKGIYIKERISRFYPFGQLAAQLLGFVGINSENEQPIGLYGSELFYNELLIAGILNLTLDRNLQVRAEEVLEGLVRDFEADGGEVIIEEPKTGKILALAGEPSFDPNFYSDYDLDVFINPAVQKVYEPGSVFKVITMAAGIDSGKITPATSYFDSGFVKVADRVIKNWDHKAHGEITMTEVIEKSVNTGAVHAERLTGHDIFYNYLTGFGFGEKTDVDLPGELGGDLRNLSKKYNEGVNFATASFGQGVAVTPIQLVNAISAIANKGFLMKPYLNTGLGPKIIRRVISEKSAKEVSEMMVSAVEKAGVASLHGYFLAGKTGTAQIPDFQNGGYLEDRFVHTFVGFGPVSNPAFTILIKLDKPNKNLAALTVVPAFKNLAQYVLNYYRIPPDKFEQ